MAAYGAFVSGHVEQLPSGNWRASRGKARLGTFPTREKALAALGTQTLAGYWPDYAIRRRPQIQDWRNEEGRWELYFARDEITGIPLSELARKDARKWLDRMLARGLAPQTIRNALGVGRQICQDALDREELESNPFRDLRLPPRYGARRGEGFTVLDPEEQLALLDATPDESWGLVAFSLHSGLRPFEVWGLSRGDVDLAAGEIRVLGKRGKVRRVPIMGLAKQAIEGALGHGGEILFPAPTGCRRARGSHPLGWKKWLKAAGIRRRVRYYDLRHTCATSLLAGWWGKPWPLTTVQQLLGHSTVKMTERYAHLVDETLRSAGRETRGLLPDGVEGGGSHSTPPHDLGADSGIWTRDLRFTNSLDLEGISGLALRRFEEREAARRASVDHVAETLRAVMRSAVRTARGIPGASEAMRVGLAELAAALQDRGES